MGVLYVGVHISRSLKEGMAWTKDKPLWTISKGVSCATKAILSFKQ